MRVITVLLCIFWGFQAFGQKKLLDSLHLACKNAKHDTVRVKYMRLAAAELRYSQSDSAINLVKEALRLADKHGYKRDHAMLHVSLGSAQRLGGDFDEALISANKAVEYAEKSKIKQDMAHAYTFMGVLFEQSGENAKAVQYWFKALSLAEILNDKSSQIALLNNLGTVFKKEEDYPQALKYYEQALALAQSVNSERQMGMLMGNIGNVHKNLKAYEKAIAYYEKSRVIREKLKDKKGLAVLLGNIGMAYTDMGQADKGLEYAFQSLKIKEDLGDKRGVAMLYCNIAAAYQAKEVYAKAIEYGEKAFEIAEATAASDEIKGSLYLLYNAHRGQKNYEKALDYFEAFKVHTDSVTTIEKAKAIAGLEAKVSLSKKEQQLAIVQKDNELNRVNAEKNRLDADRNRLESERKGRELEISLKRAEAERLYRLARSEKDKRKADSLHALATKHRLEADKLSAESKAHQAETAVRTLALYAVTSLLLGLAVFAFFVFRSRQAQKRLNVRLSDKTKQLQIANEDLHQSREEIIAQRDLIEGQKEELEYHNTQVKHSITTALAIQKALLPFDTRVRKFLKDYFVFYQPRDIVSGDFYWIERVGEKIIIVAGDCTGHGVPGAFMSLIAINLLERAVLQQNTSHPPQILEELHELVRIALKQDEIGDQSGMDMGVVTIDENGVLHFAGAKRPLYFIDSTEPTKVQVCHGTRRSIGGIQQEDKKFEEVSLSLPAESVFYLSSDGLADQNNLKRKRLKEEPIFEVLLQNYTVSMEAQRDGLKALLDAHMRDTEQRDDIMLVGIKL